MSEYPRTVLVLSGKIKDVESLDLPSPGLGKDTRYYFARPSLSATSKDTTETSDSSSKIQHLTFNPDSYDSFVRVFQIAVKARGSLTDVIVDGSRGSLDTDAESEGADHAISGQNSGSESGSGLSDAPVLVNAPSTNTSSSSSAINISEDLTLLNPEKQEGHRSSSSIDSLASLDGHGKDQTADLESEAQLLALKVENVTTPRQLKIIMWGARTAIWYMKQNQANNERCRGNIIIIGDETLPRDPTSSATSATDTEASVAAGTIGLIRGMFVSCAVQNCRISLVLHPASTQTQDRPQTGLIANALQNTTPVSMKANGIIYTVDKSSGKVKALPYSNHELTGSEAYKRIAARMAGLLMIINRIVVAIATAKRNRRAVTLGLSAAFYYLWRKGWIWRPLLIIPVLLVVRGTIANVKNAASDARNRRRGPNERSSVAVFLGSGGHTSEALQMLSALDPARYGPRTFIYCEGDSMSVEKSHDLQGSLTGAKETQATYIELPRARKVGQSFASSIFTTIWSLLFAFWHLTCQPLYASGGKEALCDLLIVNGPGTCVVVVIALMIPRLVGLPTPRTLYVESFARVHSLSLSGKILKPVVDKFVTQWPPAKKDDAGATSGSAQEKTDPSESWLI